VNRLAVCQGCLEKQRIIDQLLEENHRLKQQLRYRQRKSEEGFFGSSTPSSKIPVKANTPQQNRNRKGGARPDHVGHGRSSVDAASADRIEEIDIDETCPICGTVLQDKGYEERSVIDSRPIRAERELRPTVIARKISFGSQSDAGASTREVLMSLVYAMKKCFPDP